MDLSSLSAEIEAASRIFDHPPPDPLIDRFTERWREIGDASRRDDQQRLNELIRFEFEKKLNYRS